TSPPSSPELPRATESCVTHLNLECHPPIKRSAPCDWVLTMDHAELPLKAIIRSESSRCRTIRVSFIPPAYQPPRSRTGNPDQQPPPISSIATTKRSEPTVEIWSKSTVTDHL